MNEQMSETEQILSEPLPGEQEEKAEDVKVEEPKVEEPKTEVSKDAEEEETPQEEEEQVIDKPKKKLSGFTRRLNREREARERAEQRVAELEAKNVQPEPEATTGEPDPAKYEHGINDINYIRDMAGFQGRQAYYEAKQADMRQTQAQKFQAEVSKANTNFERSLDQAADKYEDFDEVYRSNVINMDPAVLHYLKKDKMAGDMAYYTLKNKDFGDDLSQANAMDGIAMLTELKVKLNATAKGGKSKMPKPIKTVGEGKTKVKREYTDDMSQQEFNDSFSFDDLGEL